MGLLHLPFQLTLMCVPQQQYKRDSQRLKRPLLYSSYFDLMYVTPPRMADFSSCEVFEATNAAFARMAIPGGIRVTGASDNPRGSFIARMGDFMT